MVPGDLKDHRHHQIQGDSLNSNRTLVPYSGTSAIETKKSRKVVENYMVEYNFMALIQAFYNSNLFELFPDITARRQ